MKREPLPKEPKFSFCMPVYDSLKYMPRAIDSILEQDYKNVEICVVFDGNQPEADELLRTRYKSQIRDLDIKFKTIDHAGAPAARNAALAMADGDIIVFFNSDYGLVRGAMRQWLHEFEDHPESDFLVLGYGWFPDENNKGLVYPAFESEEFDEYKITCYNYIDCGCPIRRYAIPQPAFNTEVKSLQDWDMFVRAVKNGARGHLVKGITYNAEVPRKGGLSQDSSRNWKDRMQFVKLNAGIPWRDICVSSFGASKHALNIAKMCGWDYKMLPGQKPNDYKAVYLIGNYTGQSKQFTNLNAFRGVRGEAKKIIHWVGADIFWLRHLTVGESRYLMPYFAKKYINLCESEWTKAELESYGLKVEAVVPIPPPTDFKPTPLPKEFKVAVMKTENSDFDKYCGGLMDEVMAAMPQVKFLVFGDGKCKRELQNVEHLGQVKMAELVEKASCILRIVRHDGPMMAVNEFLMAGRDAISNLPDIGVEYIDTWVDKDNWDRFGAGFNMVNYPVTKAAIIDRIIAVRDKKAGNHARRKEVYEVCRDRLDKAKYKKTIEALVYSDEETLWNKKYDTEEKLQAANKDFKDNMPEDPEKYLHGTLQNKLRWLRMNVPLVCRTLDVACNSGTVSKILVQKNGIEAHGIDLSPELVEKAKGKGVNAVVGNAKALPYPDASFDCVLLCEILEHTLEPGAMLEEAKRVLKPGGKIVGSVVDEVASGLVWSEERMHARTWNPRQLRELLSRYFEVEKCDNLQSGEIYTVFTGVSR